MIFVLHKMKNLINQMFHLRVGLDLQKLSRNVKKLFLILTKKKYLKLLVQKCLREFYSKVLLVQVKHYWRKRLLLKLIRVLYRYLVLNLSNYLLEWELHVLDNYLTLLGKIGRVLYLLMKLMRLVDNVELESTWQMTKENRHLINYYMKWTGLTIILILLYWRLQIGGMF